MSIKPLFFTNSSTGSIRKLYVIIVNERVDLGAWVLLGYPYIRQVLAVVSCFLLAFNAAFNGGVLRFLRCLGHSGSNGVQVYVGHTGGECFFIVQRL